MCLLKQTEKPQMQQIYTAGHTQMHTQMSEVVISNKGAIEHRSQCRFAQVSCGLIRLYTKLQSFKPFEVLKTVNHVESVHGHVETLNGKIPVSH